MGGRDVGADEVASLARAKKLSTEEAADRWRGDTRKPRSRTPSQMQKVVRKSFGRSVWTGDKSAAKVGSLILRSRQIFLRTVGEMSEEALG